MEGPLPCFVEISSLFQGSRSYRVLIEALEINVSFGRLYGNLRVNSRSAKIMECMT